MGSAILLAVAVAYRRLFGWPINIIQISSNGMVQHHSPRMLGTSFRWEDSLYKHEEISIFLASTDRI